MYKLNIKEKFLLNNVDGAPLVYVNYNLIYKNGIYTAIILDFNNNVSSVPWGALPVGNITIDKVSEVLYQNLYNKYKSNFITIIYNNKIIHTGKR